MRRSSTLNLEFADATVSYDTFVEDLASRIARNLEESAKYPEYICQNEAWRQFGKANVNRWRERGLIEPAKRPGRVEYKTSELRELKKVKQDYFR